MSMIVFSKYEALGNDFILVDESQDEKRKIDPSVSTSFARLLCHRKLGIGADGVITLLAPITKDGTVFMHVTNADGSIPENCGNGLRSVARYWRDLGRIADGQSFVIDTLSGPKKAKVDATLIQVELGRAKVRLDADDVKIAELCAVFARRFEVVVPTVVAFVDLGNPHLILQSDAIDVAQRELGPKLEKLDIFQNGVNVSFVKKETANAIAIRTWERGAGATDACGSGAGASVAALIASGILAPGSAVAARFRNGILRVLAKPVSRTDFEVTLSGSAHRLFGGVWESTERICD
jgi:diaminopimelate epimerase